MSDFFAGLAARAVGAAMSVAPRTPSRFESADPEGAADFPSSAAQVPRAPPLAASPSAASPAAAARDSAASHDGRQAPTPPPPEEEPRSASVEIEGHPLLAPPPAGRERGATPTLVSPRATAGESPADPSGRGAREAHARSGSATGSGGKPVDGTRPAPALEREEAIPTRRAAPAQAPSPGPLHVSPIRPAAMLEPELAGEAGAGPKLADLADRTHRDDLLPVITPRIDPFPILTSPPAAAPPNAPSSGETAAPVIRVHIGRIEVRAAPAPPAPAPARAPREPQLSLTAYLRGAR